jgi:hypothetical protein
MKKIKLLLSFTIFFSSFTFAQIDSKVKTVFGKKINPEAVSPSGHIRCLSSEYNDYLRELNPKTESSEAFEMWMAAKIEEQKSLQQIASQSGGIIYIPVVVHVIHNGDDYGTNENITDEQVLSQITVLNQDYRRLTGTPGFNSNTVGADTQVEFVLAKVDLNGNPTNGINRVNMCQESWETVDINQIVKPTTIWDPSQYMNMWCVNFTNDQLLGYAQFPESNLAGMSLASQNALSDGVVANYTTFGSSSLTTGSFSPPYDKGRTMTHEVGHYLGLRHIWGDNSACPATNTATDKDFVADTPAANAPNYGCPTGANSCTANPGNDMIQNYMDYSDDSCMNIFTIGQKARITTVLNNSPRRSTLKTSTKDIAIPLFANDAEVIIDAYCSSTASSSCTPGNQHKVLLFNRGTANLTSATINYNVNGAANTAVNWTGNLLPNKYTIVTFSTIQSSGTLNVSVATTNGIADQRASNNTANATFSFPTPVTPTNYSFTSYVYNLQGDRWGSETTWNLKNAAGTILYSGGPYSDLPAGQTPPPIIQNWTLPANGCYTFSILDSYGDGISPGNYSIKTNNGTTTVVSGSVFTFAEISSFTNNSLSSSSFDLFDSVSLYPNPVKDVVTISVPKGIELTGNYDIYNALGQKITTKKVSSENELTINTISYQTGIYFINLTIGEFSKTLRFIKE